MESHSPSWASTAARRRSGSPSRFRLAEWLAAQCADILETCALQEQLRRQTETLRESEERFRLMVEEVKDYAIFMLDAEGRIATWNTGAQRLKGYAADEVLGEHFARFYPPEVVAAGKPQHELTVAAEQGSFAEEGWRVRRMARDSGQPRQLRPCGTRQAGCAASRRSLAT